MLGKGSDAAQIVPHMADSSRKRSGFVELRKCSDKGHKQARFAFSRSGSSIVRAFGSDHVIRMVMSLNREKSE